jgi:uncharacterized delta-60 repeat protein
VKIALLSILTCLALPAAAHAGAGDLDGIHVLPAGGLAEDVLVQRDGKIAIAAEDGSDLVVWRLNADGSLDRGFGNEGKAVVSFGVPTWTVGAALQGDKVVVAGVTGDYSVVARLDGRGKLDPTFAPGGDDGDGKLTLNENLSATAIVVEHDGRIVLAGTAFSLNTVEDFALARLSVNGALESTEFDPGEFGGRDDARAVAVAPGGRLVVVGSTGKPEDVAYIGLARYLGDGKLDDTLAGTGLLKLGPGSGSSVFAQPDGRIVFTGRGETGGVVGRLTGRGAPDPTYGDAGYAATGVASNVRGGNILGALRPDGSVLVAESTQGQRGVAVTRFTPAGKHDPAFGARGTATVILGEDVALGAVAAEPDGDVIVAGTRDQKAKPRLVVARLRGAADVAAPSPAPPAADTVAPRITRLRVVRRQLRFRLSEPARVRVTIRRGRRVARLALDGRAGRNRARLRRLKPGRYRVIARPVDAAGNAGRARVTRFSRARP